jgi:hypothetical protein
MRYKLMCPIYIIGNFDCAYFTSSEIVALHFVLYEKMLLSNIF